MIQKLTLLLLVFLLIGSCGVADKNNVSTQDTLDVERVTPTVVNTSSVETSTTVPVTTTTDTPTTKAPDTPKKTPIKSQSQKLPQALGDSVWDRVAACESSGDWTTHTSNGYSGGLQFANQYWASFGGTQFAAYAWQATKEQQITIARKELAANGPLAWPICGPRAGLQRGM